MKIVYTKPLIWAILKWRFPNIDWVKGTVVTIGDTIYSHHELHPRILKHELVHVRQQRASKLYAYLYFIPRYILDRKFREKVEAEGHRAEL